MTETRAAYEAAQNEAMHTGDYAALTAYASTVADVDGEPEPPARHVDGDDYTWAGPSYPAAPVLAEDNAALREQITQLHCDYSGQIATLELRVRELERDSAALRYELKLWEAIPAEALITYWDAHDDGDDSLGEWINELRHGVNVGRYYAGLEPL